MKRIVTICVIHCAVLTFSWADLKEELSQHGLSSLRQKSKRADLVQKVSQSELKEIEKYLQNSVLTFREKQLLALSFAESQHQNKVKVLLNVLKLRKDQTSDLMLALNRCMTKEDIEIVIDLAKTETIHQEALWKLIASRSSKKSFDFIYSHRNKAPNNLNLIELLKSSVNYESIATVKHCLQSNDPKLKEIGVHTAMTLLGKNSDQLKGGTDLAPILLDELNVFFADLDSKKKQEDIKALVDILIEKLQALESAKDDQHKKMIEAILGDKRFNREVCRLAQHRYANSKGIGLEVLRAKRLQLPYVRFEKWRHELANLCSADAKLRSRTLLKMKDTKDRLLIPLMISFFDDPFAQVREDAADSVYLILSESKSSTSSSQSFRIVLSFNSRPSRPKIKQDNQSDLKKALVKLLSDIDPDVQIAAIQTLVKLGDKSAWNSIIDLAYSERMPVQISVVDAIAKKEMRNEAFKALSYLLNHDKWQLRARASRAYWEMGVKSENEIALIMKHLKEEKDDFVKAELERAFAKTDASKTRNFWLNKWKTSKDKKSLAVQILATNPPKEIVEETRAWFKTHSDKNFQSQWLEAASEHKIQGIEKELNIALESKNDRLLYQALQLMKTKKMKISAEQIEKLVEKAEGYWIDDLFEYIITKPDFSDKDIPVLKKLIESESGYTQNSMLGDLSEKAYGLSHYNINSYSRNSGLFAKKKKKESIKPKHIKLHALLKDYVKSKDRNLARMSLSYLLKYRETGLDESIKALTQFNEMEKKVIEFNVNQDKDSKYSEKEKEILEPQVYRLEGGVEALIETLSTSRDPRYMSWIIEAMNGGVADSYYATNYFNQLKGENKKALVKIYSKMDIKMKADLFDDIMVSFDLESLLSHLKLFMDKRVSVSAYNFPEVLIKKLGDADFETFKKNIPTIVALPFDFPHNTYQYRRIKLSSEKIKFLKERQKQSDREYGLWAPVLAHHMSEDDMKKFIPYLMTIEGSQTSQYYQTYTKYPKTVLKIILDQIENPAAANLLNEMLKYAQNIKLDEKTIQKLDNSLKQSNIYQKISFLQLLLKHNHVSENVIQVWLQILDQPEGQSKGILLNFRHDYKETKNRKLIEDKWFSIYQSTQNKRLKQKLMNRIFHRLDIEKIMSKIPHEDSSDYESAQMRYPLQNYFYQRPKLKDWGIYLKYADRSKFYIRAEDMMYVSRRLKDKKYITELKNLFNNTKSGKKWLIFPLIQSHLGKEDVPIVFDFLIKKQVPDDIYDEMVKHVVQGHKGLISDSLPQFIKKKDGPKIIKAIAPLNIKLPAKSGDWVINHLDQFSDEMKRNMLRMFYTSHHHQNAFMKTHLHLLKKPQHRKDNFVFELTPSDSKSVNESEAFLNLVIEIPEGEKDLKNYYKAKQIELYELASIKTKIKALPFVLKDLSNDSILDNLKLISNKKELITDKKSFIKQLLLKSKTFSARQWLSLTKVMLDLNLKFPHRMSMLQTLQPDIRIAILKEWENLNGQEQEWLWPIVGYPLNDESIHIFLDGIRSKEDGLEYTIREELNKSAGVINRAIEKNIKLDGLVDHFANSEIDFSIQAALKIRPYLNKVENKDRLAVKLARVIEDDSEILNMVKTGLENDDYKRLYLRAGNVKYTSEAWRNIRKKQIDIFLKFPRRHKTYNIYSLTHLPANEMLLILNRVKTEKKLEPEYLPALVELSSQQAEPFVKMIIENMNGEQKNLWSLSHMIKHKKHRYNWFSDDINAVIAEGEKNLKEVGSIFNPFDMEDEEDFEIEFSE